MRKGQLNSASKNLDTSYPKGWTYLTMILDVEGGVCENLE
jgi:molybdenum-dependent DNA-binding transcriptional regulator ModE